MPSAWCRRPWSIGTPAEHLLETRTTIAEWGITTELCLLVAGVERPGDFYGMGVAPLPVVRLAVDGSHPTSFPRPGYRPHRPPPGAGPAPALRRWGLSRARRQTYNHAP